LGGCLIVSTTPFVSEFFKYSVKTVEVVSSVRASKEEESKVKTIEEVSGVKTLTEEKICLKRIKEERSLV
jgi:hypothetical protein